MPLIGRTVERRRQIVDNGVEQRLHALVLERRAAQHREERRSIRALRSSFLIGLVRDFLAVQIVFHRLIVEFGAGFDHLGAGLLRRVLGRPGFLRRELRAERFVLPRRSPSCDEIDKALEVGFGADRQLNRNRLGAETFLDVLEHCSKFAPVRSILLTNTCAERCTCRPGANGFGLRLNALVRDRARRQRRRARAANARLQW